MSWIDNKTFLFISGFTKSGTSLLTQCMEIFPEVSTQRHCHKCSETIVEGQWCQNAYVWKTSYVSPWDSFFRKTRSIDGITKQLRSDWAELWDMTKSVLVEKSPHNMIKLPMLKEVFPNSKFLVLIRNPIVLLTGEHIQEHTNIDDLIHQINVAYAIANADTGDFKKDVRFLRYEDFILAPQQIMDDIAQFIGCKPQQIGNRMFARDFKYMGNQKKQQFKIQDMNYRHIRNFFKHFTTEKQKYILRKLEKLLIHFRYRFQLEYYERYMRTKNLEEII